MADFDAIVVGAGNAALDIGAQPFGGWRINDRSEVQDLGERTIPGLYGAGELVGGRFCENYPGGSGLMSGSVFGRRAGGFAAAYAALT